MKKAVLLLVTLIMVSGCFGVLGVNSGNKGISKQSNIEALQKGVTTKQQAKEMFGEPQHTVVKNNKEVWKYEHGVSNYTVFGKSTKTKNLTLTFDKNGKLLNFNESSKKPE